MEVIILEDNYTCYGKTYKVWGIYESDIADGIYQISYLHFMTEKYYKTRANAVRAAEKKGYKVVDVERVGECGLFRKIEKQKV